MVEAATSAYPLVIVNPAWQQHVTILYQGNQIQGFYYHQVRFKNTGNRSVKDLPITITAPLNSIIAWPLMNPKGCLLNLQFPVQNQLTAQIDFINPEENVDVSFWAFNDTVGTITVTARAPDVEFKLGNWKVWETTAQRVSRISFRIGQIIHQITFWLGSIVIIYGLYRGIVYLYGAAVAAWSQ